MLRSEGYDRRFADKAGKPLVIGGWKAIIPSRNDLVEFVERIPVRHPGFTFLVRIEQVSLAIEGKRIRNTDSCRECLKLSGFRIELLYGSTRRMQVVKRYLRFRV